MGFDRRGIVLLLEDLALEAWPEMARSAGLNVIALHVLGGMRDGAQALVEFVQSDEGKRVLDRIREAGLDIEYEIHAMSYLLPRRLFEYCTDPFRMDENGKRTPEGNLCVSCAPALTLTGLYAVELSRILKPTTHRHFLWGDDGGPRCACEGCRELTPADHSLLMTNAIARALRQSDPEAKVAALAYQDALDVPQYIRPEPNVFLEFAPIKRDSSRPLSDPDCEINREIAAKCRALVEFYGATDAHVLGYWLDASRASRWSRPVVEPGFDRAVLEADLDFYSSLGFSSVTSFGCWLDADYIERFGRIPVDEYGAALSGR